MTEYIKRSDAIHAVLHNEGQAAVAAVQEIKAVDPFMDAMLYDYPVRDLILFAEACKIQHVTKDDLKRVVNDITWAAEAVYKATDEAMKNMADDMTTTFRVELPPPINPKRLKKMEWHFDELKSVKMPEIKTMDINEWRKEQTDETD